MTMHTFYARLLICFCFAICSNCQSAGQNKNDESDWSHRLSIPESIIAPLPSSPDTLFQSAHFQAFSYGSVKTSQIESLLNKSESSFQKFSALLGRPNYRKSIKWYFYPSSEIKGLLRKNSHPCELDFANNSVHFVVNEYFNDYYLGNANAIFIRQEFGESHYKIFESGFALLLSDEWQKLGYKNWAAKLRAAEQLPSLSELFNNENWEFASELIYGSAAASFCDFLLTEIGVDKFIDAIIAENFDFFQFENDWRSSLIFNSPTLHTDSQLLPFLKGFNFAHEGYRIYNGYGSRKSDQALAYLNELRANTIAIVPYSFVRNPKTPAPIPVVKSAGMENDESVIQSAEKAQQLGLKVVVKPQIWVGRSMWTGDIEMSNDEDWLLFFHYYGHWITHYAMLSEIYTWDMLCLGNELVQTTLQREQDWIKLIHAIREIYNGPLIYAANWGEEFEQTRFWNHLDAIGLNCYYPLSDKDNPSQKDLEKGFKNVIEKIEKVHNQFHKPIILTEIGFPCIQHPWKQPHQDWGDFVPNAEHQKRCYEIVSEGLSGHDWCTGILWWKFPSDLDHQHRRQTGFTPFNKPAEHVVAKWFKSID